MNNIHISMLKLWNSEKDGYTWMQEESLAELIKPERIERSKKNILKTQRKADGIKSKYLVYFGRCRSGKVVQVVLYKNFIMRVRLAT
ncbi:MAG: hypothetical protein IPO37_21505 [Saprospiraceae bacterium]|nr:hypothetical protein [Saprospiraceae bacterium]